jgi:hypothetical protein
MSSGKHSSQTITDGGIHSAISFVYASADQRTAATFVSTDQYKFAFQQSDATYWVLVDPIAPTWQELTSSGFNPTGVQGDILYNDGTGFVNLSASNDGYVLTTHGALANPTWSPSSTLGLTSTPPPNVANVSASAGVSTLAARGDHQHGINPGTPVSIGATNAQGVATTLALSDHAHSVVDLAMTSQVQGSVIYFNGSNWVVLNPGTDGYYLTTHNTGNNPTWTKKPIAGTDLSLPGQTVGDLLQFNGSNWVRVPNGTTGQFLTANTSALSTWSNQSTVATDLNIIGETQGDVLYFNGVNWTRLGAGTNGQSLITHGAGSNPTWDTNYVAQNITSTGALNIGAPITINNLASAPNILQATDSTTISGVGQTLSLKSQTVSGFNTRGGNLQLSSGTGTSAQGAPDGYVTINRGVQTVASWLTGVTNIPGTGTPDDFIAFGKLPGTQGNIRMSTSSAIYGRNVANTQNQALLYWGTGSTDTLDLGNTALAATRLNGSAVGIQAISNVTLLVNSNPITQWSSTSFQMNVNNLLWLGAAVTAPTIKPLDNQGISQVGLTMLLQSQNTIGFNSRGGIVQLTSGTGTTIAPVAGDVANGGAPDGYVQIFRGTQQVANWGVGMRLPGATQTDDFITFGKFAATQGNLRFSPNTVIQGRNFANSVNQNLLTWSQFGSDQLVVGNTSTVALVNASNLQLVSLSVPITFAPQGVNHTLSSTSLIFDAQNNLGINRGIGILGGNIPISGIGQTLQVLGQSGTAVLNTRGGNLLLGSGQGSAVAALAPDGYVAITRGAQAVAQWNTGQVLTGQTLVDDFIVIGRTPANTGNIRLANPSLIVARNAANSADINIGGIDTNNNLVLGSNTAASATSGAATLPTNPLGFISINLNNAGTIVKIPYYNN